MNTILKSLLTLILLTLIISGCANEGNKSELKSLVDKYVEFWNTGNYEEIQKILDEDFILNESPSFEGQKGIVSLRQTVISMRKTYPDIKLEINEMVIENDNAAVLMKVKGTNTGPGDIPRTGKVIEVTGMAVFHFDGGKITEVWMEWNDYQWLSQLGYTILPPATYQTIKPDISN